MERTSFNFNSAVWSQDNDSIKPTKYTSLNILFSIFGLTK